MHACVLSVSSGKDCFSPICDCIMFHIQYHLLLHGIGHRACVEGHVVLNGLLILLMQGRKTLTGVYYQLSQSHVRMKCSSMFRERHILKLFQTSNYKVFKVKLRH